MRFFDYGGASVKEYTAYRNFHPPGGSWCSRNIRRESKRCDCSPGREVNSCRKKPGKHPVFLGGWPTFGTGDNNIPLVFYLWKGWLEFSVTSVDTTTFILGKTWKTSVPACDVTNLPPLNRVSFVLNMAENRLNPSTAWIKCWGLKLQWSCLKWVSAPV